METIRTPDERFADLGGHSFAPHYSQVPDGENGTLRIHHVDEGPPDGEVVLCMHGQPSWSYLYRKMIPVFADAGYRVLAPDLVGFGRSDKPTSIDDYSYARHVAGARKFPSLVPVFPDDPEIPANQAAWRVLERFERPFRTAFSDDDPVTAGLEKVFQERVPGAKQVEHVTISGGGHFLQENQGPLVAREMIAFMQKHPA